MKYTRKNNPKNDVKYIKIGGSSNDSVYIVFGLGCKSMSDRLKELIINELNASWNIKKHKKRASKEKNRASKEINTKTKMNIICHKTTSALKTIVLRKFNGTHLNTKQSGYRFRFLKQITDDIINNKKVYVYGHSFGGAIVNQIAEELQKLLSDTQRENCLWQLMEVFTYHQKN